MDGLLFLLFCVNAKNKNLVWSPLGPSRKLIGTLNENNLDFQIRYYSPQIGVTFYEENCMHVITTFGVRGEIEPKNAQKATVAFVPLKKTITPNP